MTSIKISNQLSTTSTTISNVFIDRYMPPANGEFVKVYLYLIRMASCGHAPTITDMADALDNTESDVCRALKYWQKQNLLLLHYNSLQDIEFIELLPIPEETEPKANGLNVIASHSHCAASSQRTVPPKETIAPQPVPAQTPANVVTMPPAKPDYDFPTVQEQIENSELKHLPYEAEILLGSTLAPNDILTLYYLHDKLDFSADLISYLIEYCVLNDKKSMRYIEKTAINWHEHGIRTVEAARSYSSRYTRINSAVMRAMGLQGASLAEAQLKYVQKWETDYGMDLSLIVEACNRTMLQTGNPSFQYADKILSNWHNAGITCLEQVEKESRAFRASQQQKQQTYPKRTAKPANTTPNQFHDFIQGEDIDYDAIIPKTIQPDSSNFDH